MPPWHSHFLEASDSADSGFGRFLSVSGPSHPDGVRVRGRDGSALAGPEERVSGEDQVAPPEGWRCRGLGLGTHAGGGGRRPGWRQVRLDAVAGEGSKFDYVYDFGDDWRHRIVVEKVLAPDDGAAVTVPACVDGRRACPPEDCGGTWGYEELLAILADPSHPECEATRLWAGHEFDPAAFDAGDFETNLRNQQLAGGDDWP